MTTPIGVAGIFPGRFRYPDAQLLARFEIPELKGVPSYTSLESVSAERISAGEILLRMELRGEPLPRRPGLYYRHFLDTTGPFTPGGMPFGQEEMVASVFWRDGRWQFRVDTIDTSMEAEGAVDGREIRIVVPLGKLARGGSIRWFADAVDFDVSGAFSQFSAQVLEIAPGEGAAADLSRLASGVYRGPIFEVFHGHPVRSGMGDCAKQFYKHFADNADFLVFYMSGRRDWTEGGARSSGAVAGGIRGAGLPSQWRTDTGSAGRLQGMQEVSWIGAYSCEPSGRSRDFGYFEDYSLAVWMNGHELGHRWGIVMDPPGRSEFPRISDNVHWLWELHHPADFCEPGPPCGSLMGGGYWEEAQAGYYVQRARNGYLQATGYGPLDLYLMGLAEAREIPRLFVLTNPQWEFRWGHGWGFLAGKKEFSIEDIIRQLGPRWPEPAHSQKEFNTAYVFFVLEGDELRQSDLERVDGIRQAWMRHFHAATLGRATMTSQIEERSGSGLQVVSGDHQWVETGAQTEFPVVFRLVDGDGQPVSSAALEIRIQGDARLPLSDLRTDRAGELRLRITAGSTPGKVRLTAIGGNAGQATATLHVAPPAAR